MLLLLFQNAVVEDIVGEAAITLQLPTVSGVGEIPFIGNSEIRLNQISIAGFGQLSDQHISGDGIRVDLPMLTVVGFGTVTPATFGGFELDVDAIPKAWEIASVSAARPTWFSQSNH